VLCRANGEPGGGSRELSGRSHLNAPQPSSQGELDIRENGGTRGRQALPDRVGKAGPNLFLGEMEKTAWGRAGERGEGAGNTGLANHHGIRDHTSSKKKISGKKTWGKEKKMLILRNKRDEKEGRKTGKGKGGRASCTLRRGAT